tara:strand:- start:5924 stop:6304 length:381 start_codon:yes stop_codon:yes gene_type:complete
MVNRPQFQNGGYTVGGKKYKMLVGSRAQVWNGTAQKTSYGRAGLKKSDLLMNKWGRIVSKRKHKTGKKSGLKRLHAKGYFTKKGKFGVFKKKGKTAKKGRKSKRCRHKSGPKKGKYKKCKTKKRRR